MSHQLIEAIAQLEDLYAFGAADEQAIQTAEAALGLRFAPDYRIYVSTYGFIAAFGLEWSGITTVPHLDVVKMTLAERDSGSNMAPDMYVIENLGIEGIVAAQDSTGAVYWLAPGKQPEKAYDSLVDYLTKFPR